MRRTHMTSMKLLLGASALIATVAAADLAVACSRVLWADNGQAVVVGRNMDWPVDTRAKLWAFPRGITRSGLSGDDNSLQWTSKYGSVAVSFYDVGTADGINEKGLVVNSLWLTEADYGPRDPKLPGLSLALWLQYMLDNFATVTEAVQASEHDAFQVVGLNVPGGDAATLHIALADASGDSAIIEIVGGGKVRIHHDRSYRVMTNSPSFPEQLANLQKYQGFGGAVALPGTSEAADRFVRAAYYLQNLPKPQDFRQTIASILSVMRNVAQPFMQPDPKRPEASHTVWRTVSDATDREYFFESTLSPNIVWVRLDGLDLKPGAPVRKLDLMHNVDLVGDVTGAFQPSEPLTFAKGGS